jgi:hypothetical protein
MEKRPSCDPVITGVSGWRLCSFGSRGTYFQVWPAGTPLEAYVVLHSNTGFQTPTTRLPDRIALCLDGRMPLTRWLNQAVASNDSYPPF